MADFITSLNDSYWGVVVWILVGSGVYFGIRTIVVQIRLLPDMFGAVTESPSQDDDILAQGAAAHAGEKGTKVPEKSISPFKAFTISAAWRIGTSTLRTEGVWLLVGGAAAAVAGWVTRIVG